MVPVSLRKNNRWGYFPSASIAWRMEQEEFLKDVSWLNQLKLRFSYGATSEIKVLILILLFRCMDKDLVKFHMRMEQEIKRLQWW